MAVKLREAQRMVCGTCERPVRSAWLDGRRITIEAGPVPGGELAVYADPHNGSLHVRWLGAAGEVPLRHDEYRGRPHNATCYGNAVRVA